VLGETCQRKKQIKITTRNDLDIVAFVLGEENTDSGDLDDEHQTNVEDSVRARFPEDLDIGAVKDTHL
jgi:hypothetical protein